MPIVPAGSVNLNAIGVPNVLVQIQAPNPLLNGVPTNIAGFVGVASYGAVNSPVTIGTLQEQIAHFGFPMNRTYDLGTQIYNAIQQGANDFVCIRVTDGTDTSAFSDILDNTSAIGVVLTAKYTGSFANTEASTGLQAVISVGSLANTFRLTVYFIGGVPEVFDNIGGSGAAFWANLADAVNLGQNNLRPPSNLVTASTGNNIGSITVDAAGSYATLPTPGTTGSGSGAVLALNMKAVSATPTARGTGYAPADTITFTGGVHSSNAIVTVSNVSLVSTALNAAGSGYNIGDTIVLAGGTFSAAAIITVSTIAGGGAISTFTVSTLGAYTVRPSSFTQGSTSGLGTGATFNTNVWGVNAVTVTTPGSYTTLASNPVAQGASSGSGTGATFTVLWGLLSVSVSDGGTGYTPSSNFVVTGGGGTGGALGTIVLGGATGSPGGSLPVTYSFSGGTDGNTGVTDATLIGLDTGTRSGMYALRNTRASIGVLCDQTNPTYWTNQVTFGLSEGIYMIGAMANIYSDQLAAAVAAKLASGVSSYIFKLMLGDWILINDPFNNVQRYTSPQGFVAGILATLNPSGSSLNKQMNGIIATQKTANKEVYSDADLLLLIQNGIDVITSPIPLSPNSPVYGCRLGCNTSPSITTNGDNYPRMVNFLAETFEQGLGDFIGLPQTVDVQRQARNTLQTFLRNLQTTGSIGTIDGSPAFRVVLDSTNNPAPRVAEGFMQADVQVTLLSIIQRFVINLQAGQSVQIQILPAQLVA